MADKIEKLEKIETEEGLNRAPIKPIEDFVSPEVLHQELIDSIHKYHPSAHSVSGF